MYLTMEGCFSNMSVWLKLVMYMVQMHTTFINFLLTHLTLTLIYHSIKSVEFVGIEIKIELCSDAISLLQHEWKL